MTPKMIVTATHSTLRLALGVACSAGLLLTNLLPAQAQTTRPAPLEDLQTKDGSDPFNGRGSSQTGGMMNFIQNAIIGAPRSMDEFSAGQQENFNDATSRFRQMQAEQLRKKAPQANPDSSVAPLPTGTPVTP